MRPKGKARGNIYSRLERLEASPVLTARHGGDTARERLLSDFTVRALDAMAHVRRASIDDPRWRYTLEGLRDESPFTLAAYVAALTALRHPDEGEARASRRRSGRAGGRCTGALGMRRQLRTVCKLRTVKDEGGGGIGYGTL
jgi:hypothetical protein